MQPGGGSKLPYPPQIREAILTVPFFMASEQGQLSWGNWLLRTLRGQEFIRDHKSRRLPSEKVVIHPGETVHSRPAGLFLPS